MKFDQAIDLFIEDRRVQGRITSRNTIKAYRSDLGVMQGIVSNRDPRKVGRLDVNPGPTLICALRAGRPEHTPEAEPVLVETVGDAIVLALDDGERLEFDRIELLSALGAVIAGDMGSLRAA